LQPRLKKYELWASEKDANNDINKTLLNQVRGNNHQINVKNRYGMETRDFHDKQKATPIYFGSV
jgi:hypothetical protein